MTPKQAVIDSIIVAIGSNTFTFAGTLYMHLLKEPFAESPAYVPPNANMATFDGYAPVLIDMNTRPTSTDPLTGDQLMVINPDTDPFYFETTGTTNLPQTIYGIALSSSSTTFAAGAYMGCEALALPVELSGTGQSIVIHPPVARMLANPFAIVPNE